MVNIYQPSNPPALPGFTEFGGQKRLGLEDLWGLALLVKHLTRPRTVLIMSASGLLGHAVIEVDGQSLSGLPSRMAEALLIYLVCHDRPVLRETLANLL